jgi:hypothetical protein
MSCFRNEKYDEVPFVFSAEWQLPSHGFFEFDFVYLHPGPRTFHSDARLSPPETANILTLLSNDSFSLEERIFIFKQISEYVTMSSTDLSENIIDIDESEQWVMSAYLSGISRIHDGKTNHDFIKTQCKNPETMRKIYNAFGILNLFSMQRVNGAF